MQSASGHDCHVTAVQQTFSTSFKFDVAVGYANLSSYVTLGEVAKRSLRLNA